jgi:hypothetical protein
VTTAIVWGNLTAIFAVELAGLVAFGVWGAQAVSPTPGRWALAITLPLTAAVLWSLFCAPHALVPLPGPAVTVIKLTMLAAAVLALIAAGLPRCAGVLAAVALITTVLAQVLPAPAPT